LYISILLLGSGQLQELIKKNQNSHFFLDEVHVTQNQIPSKVLADISKTISKNSFLWIACQGDRLPARTDPNLQGDRVNI
jgi:hypothetical protein